MPKLGHPKLIRQDAVFALVAAYLEDAQFIQELVQLRRRHPDGVRLAADALRHPFPVPLEPSVSLHEAKDCIIRSLVRELGTTTHRPETPVSEEVAGYTKELIELLYRWKLRSDSAYALLLAMGDSVSLSGSGNCYAKVPLEAFDGVMPWSPPLPPLRISISSWALICKGRRPVLEDIAKALADYEEQIKKTGISENRAALEQHAGWWFLRHVKNKSYEWIAENAGERRHYDVEYVRKAVWKFSRVVDIKLK